jgi:exodeoxyribonuclease VII large subunit
MPSHFTLSQVTQSIKKYVDERFAKVIWVKAEINKMNVNRTSGNAYAELVEKQNGKIIAEMRGNIFRNAYERINQRFISVLAHPLKDGITALLQVQVSFHPVFGLSLEIMDIDPVFTLGEIEREKQESINRLKLLGLFDKNKQHILSIPANRIAIISQENSAGYSDFMSVLRNNERGFAFFTFLFPATLNGDQAVKSIVDQLTKIEKVKSHFDAVAIVRGGGGDTGMTCYNHFDLSKKIAEFPLPVFTGIGHSTNLTVVEQIAYRNAITPTELAMFFVTRLQQLEQPLLLIAENLLPNIEGFLSYLGDEMSVLIKKLHQNVQLNLAKKHSNLDQSTVNLKNQLNFMFKRQMQHVENKENSIRLLDPTNLYKRGYTLTLHNGKPISTQNLPENKDDLTTYFYGGVVQSEVQIVTLDQTSDSNN